MRSQFETTDASIAFRLAESYRELEDSRRHSSDGSESSGRDSGDRDGDRDRDRHRDKNRDRDRDRVTAGTFLLSPEEVLEQNQEHEQPCKNGWLHLNPLSEPSERELVCENDWRKVFRCVFIRR